ncbi:hypothetical protein AYX14_01012 [Cryptococcus neoformans]|nr:hypothetical protein AYX15_00071 [Cryptococcus neoformans var. grubii]OWZ73472.1 hypothetical protein AYX14_01012 [Cryptococcus neoformans var. grubii]
MISVQLLAILLVPFTFAISLPYVYTEPLTHLDQEPFSPQFMGCVREDYIMGLTEDGYLLDISMENNNEDCIKHCLEDGLSRYAFFNYKDRMCHCSTEQQYIPSADYRDGDGDAGACTPYQTIITYLVSPFTFSGCTRSSTSTDLNTSIRSFITFATASHENCLDLCGDNPEANVAEVTPTYNAEHDWWCFQCSCFNGQPPSDEQSLMVNQERDTQLVTWEDYKASCGFDSVFKYERTIQRR